MENKKDDQNISKSGVDAEKYPKLAKATELAANQKIRAEKAEAKLKELAKPVEMETPTKPQEKETPIKPVETETPKNEYSLKDMRALNDVHDDDVDEVVEYAKSKGISVAEAKKAPMIQSYLRDTEEKRKTAEATSTGKSKRGSSKISGIALLKKFDGTGELPESDEDMDKFVKARMTRRHLK